MRITLVKVSKKFEKQYKKLPIQIKKLAINKEMLFREDAFDSRLKTHKLHGKHKKSWAFEIDNSYRITAEKRKTNFSVFQRQKCFNIFDIRFS